MKSTIFWDITPCSPLKVNRRFGGTCLHLQGLRISQARKQICLLPAFTLVSGSAYTSTLKMEAICTSETSIEFKRNSRRYIPKDGTLQINPVHNFTPYSSKFHFTIILVPTFMFSSGSEIKALYIFLIYIIRAVFPASFILFELIILIVFGEEYKI
jgi:hypothetical protein